MWRTTGALAALLMVALTGMATGTARADSPSTHAVEVVGTAFRLSRPDGVVLTGAALAGATLTVAGPEGRPFALRIGAVEPDPLDPSGEILLHRFAIQNPETGAWQDACDPDAAGTQAGFPLPGTVTATGEYRPDAPGFTLTCTSGALGKCVRFGYRPWHEDIAWVGALALYQACLRLVRADYCGDGRSFTREGTLIDLYDRVGIQQDEPLPGMSFEAAWGRMALSASAARALPPSHRSTT